MSYLDKEDEEWLYLTRYLHHEPDSYSEWECEGNTCPSGKYSEKVHEAERYAFYEIKAEYKINKKTGEVIYLTFS